MLTMLLGGLWHGASWSFVLWGAIHGAALAIERALERIGLLRPTERAGVVRWGVTLFVVLLAWIPFRVHDIGRATYAMGQMLWVPGWFADLEMQIFELVGRTAGVTLPLLLLLAFIPAHLLLAWRASGGTRARVRTFATRGAGYPVLLALLVVGAIFLAPVDPSSFIYFRF